MTFNRRIRPVGIIILAIIALWIAVWNGLRLSEAVFFWRVLEGYHASPLYIAISGGFWLVSALTLAFGIWQGKPWAWAGTICSMTGYGIWYWFDRFFLQAPHSNWPFALAFFILLVGTSATIIFRKKTREYFWLISSIPK
jgi:hypothetical protein